MKFIHLFNSPLYEMLSEKGKKESDKEFTGWLLDVTKFFICGFIFGFIFCVVL